MNKVIKGIFWRTLQQYGIYITKLVVQTILARILMPEEFGVIVKVLAFISIAEVISVSGLGTALIQKKETSTADYATALVASIFISAIMYILLFFLSPIISEFYNTPIIKRILRVYGIAIFVQSYASIQNSYVIKNFELKKSFIANLVAYILSGIVAIIMALIGNGIWALVVQSLLGSFLTIVFLHIMVPWKPQINFRFDKFKQMFSFSWKVLVSSLVGNLLENIYNLTIGRYYGDATLGYYNRGTSYPAVIVGQMRTAIGVVSLPAYSELQDENDKLIYSIRKTTQLSVFVIFPIAFGLSAVAEAMITVLLTEKWLPCVFFLRLECVFYGVLPITTSIGNGVTAIGRSGVAMKVEITKLLATILCVLCLNKYSVEVMCIARTLIAILSVWYYAFIAQRLIGYGMKKLIIDIWKPLLSSCIMGKRQIFLRIS